MSGSELRHRNHFISQAYLHRWTSADGKLWTYRTLVSDDRVPVWRKHSPKGLGRHEHLYTRLLSSGESDEVERWLCDEFETPAEASLRKAVSDAPLRPSDWQHLVRYLALHDARTPQALARYLRWADVEVPKIIDNILKAMLEKLKLVKEGRPLPHSQSLPYSDYLPIRIRCEPGQDSEHQAIAVETIGGRGSWLHAIRSQLSGRSLRALLTHRWTILAPPTGVTWFTSDAPVIKLNLFDSGRYNFGGGTGNPGTMILFPLSPQHLMLTMIGVSRRPLRGTRIPAPEAAFVRRIMAEHAHRSIFALEADSEVPTFRSRVVNAEAYKAEVEGWRSWHHNQTVSELELRRP